MAGTRKTKRKRAAKPKTGRVESAVAAEIAEIAKRDRALAGGALAAMALQLASELDDPTNSATSKAACARAMREALTDLRMLAPEPEYEDDLDRLRAKRAKRRASAAN